MELFFSTSVVLRNVAGQKPGSMSVSDHQTNTRLIPGCFFFSLFVFYYGLTKRCAATKLQLRTVMLLHYLSHSTEGCRLLCTSAVFRCNPILHLLLCTHTGSTVISLPSQGQCTSDTDIYSVCHQARALSRMLYNHVAC